MSQVVAEQPHPLPADSTETTRADIVDAHRQGEVTTGITLRLNLERCGVITQHVASQRHRCADFFWVSSEQSLGDVVC
eukprot:m.299043 g.299043  ORF g.299043 m.299043 type:complete len:78 (-) comp15867_c0_seq1:1136-1369(-)